MQDELSPGTQADDSKRNYGNDPNLVVAVALSEARSSLWSFSVSDLGVPLWIVMEELSQNNNPNLNPNPSPIRNPLSSSMPVWPTIDGPLGLSEEDSLSYARRFYKFGFALLPLLWAVNCFYFWPVLRHAHSFPRIRRCMSNSLFLFQFRILFNILV